MSSPSRIVSDHLLDRVGISAWLVRWYLSTYLVRLRFSYRTLPFARQSCIWTNFLNGLKNRKLCFDGVLVKDSSSLSPVSRCSGRSFRLIGRVIMGPTQSWLSRFKRQS